MIVVGASVLAPALADDGVDGPLARDRLRRAAPLHAPALIDLEVLSALRRWIATGDMSPRRARSALSYLLALRLRRHPHRHLTRRIWALRDNVTPYEGAYVALAEALGAALITADARLARATGPRCQIEVLHV